MSVDTYIQTALNAGMAVMAFWAARVMRDEPEKASSVWLWRAIGAAWSLSAIRGLLDATGCLSGLVADLLGYAGIALALILLVIGSTVGIRDHYRDLRQRWRDEGLGVSKPLGTWMDRSWWPVVTLAIVGLAASALYHNACDFSLHVLMGFALLLCVAILVAALRMLLWLQVRLDAAVIHRWSSRPENGPDITGVSS